MNIARSSFITLPRTLVLIGAILALVPASAVRADDTSDKQAEMMLKGAAGSIKLTTGLLDGLDKFAKQMGDNSGAKEEFVAMGKDSSITPDNMNSTMESKYPKLTAAFKSAGLTPEDFMKAAAALGSSSAMAEGGMDGGDDKTVQSNISFCKANKERITATMSAMQTLG